MRYSWDNLTLWTFQFSLTFTSTTLGLKWSMNSTGWLCANHSLFLSPWKEAMANHFWTLAQKNCRSCHAVAKSQHWLQGTPQKINMLMITSDLSLVQGPWRYCIVEVLTQCLDLWKSGWGQNRLYPSKTDLFFYRGFQVPR